MATLQKWVLTQSPDTNVESFQVQSSHFPSFSPVPWSISKRRLQGGRSEGVDLIEIVQGSFAFSVCPTRGMGIWKGSIDGKPLGWDSPVRGPVHPAFVSRDELGGIGWLQGFDEWIVRCGLNNNGAPATDRLLDNTGAEQSMPLPLHGRIANIPAHYVEIRLETEPAPHIAVVGHVDEAMLFFPQLRLEATVTTTLGESQFTIRDRIVNGRSQPAELELLYHTNFGPFLLEEGARFLAPIDRLAAINAHSLKAMDRWNVYPAPTAGVIEECFVMKLLADAQTNETCAMLENASRTAACRLRFPLSQLPWFTLWRNPAALSDGYVTGLEPGTDLPNAKPFERSQGRVVSIPAGGFYETTLHVEVADDAKQVAAWERDIERLQSRKPATIETGLPADLTPG